MHAPPAEGSFCCGEHGSAIKPTVEDYNRQQIGQDDRQLFL
jgi:hypothetical protein